MSQRGYPAHLALFMLAYYAANCMYQSFMSLYYTSIPFTSAQIGLINAAVALVSLAAQPFWGIVGDRASSRRSLIALLSLASAAAVLAFRASARFVPLLLLACLFSCFYTSIQPMGDSIILKTLDERRQPFGPIRMAGGISFALGGIAFGRLLDRPGGEGMVPVYTAILCGAVALSTLVLPRAAGGQAAGGRRMSFGELLRNRELVALLLFLAPMQITMGYFYTFFSPHFVSLEGGTGALLGLCYTISACSEFVFLFFSDRLFDRFGPGKLMCVSAAALTARWLILATSRSVPVVMASQLLHGWGFIVMTVCLAKYISRHVPPELQASGQMLLAIVSFGIARVAGNLGGGWLAGVMGRQNVFYVCAGITALALAVFAPRYFGKKAQ